jgi:hypothetical protein
MMDNDTLILAWLTARSSQLKALKTSKSWVVSLYDLHSTMSEGVKVQRRTSGRGAREWPRGEVLGN